VIRPPSLSLRQRLQRVQQERRSVAVAYLLWALGLLALPFGLPLGLSGVHRFYCGKPVSGALWLFTQGLCGVGQLVDLFLIPELVRQANQPLVLEEALAQAPWPELPPLDRQLLQLARRSGQGGFTINDALIELQLPASISHADVGAEIERLLHAHLLDVGNDERGRVVYREP